MHCSIISVQVLSSTHTHTHTHTHAHTLTLTHTEKVPAFCCFQIFNIEWFMTISLDASIPADTSKNSNQIHTKSLVKSEQKQFDGIKCTMYKTPHGIFTIIIIIMS